jgi:hypothetical protein
MATIRRKLERISSTSLRAFTLVMVVASRGPIMGDERAAQRFIRAVALAAVILPSAATAETRDEMRELETILSSAKPLGSCQAIGFEVDWDTLGGKIDSLMTRLVNSGVSEEDIARRTQEVSAESDRLLPVLKAPDLSQGNPREAFDEVEAVFTTIQRRCEELTNEPELSAHHSGPVPARGGH